MKKLFLNKKRVPVRLKKAYFYAGFYYNKKCLNSLALQHETTKWNLGTSLYFGDMHYVIKLYTLPAVSLTSQIDCCC